MPFGIIAAILALTSSPSPPLLVGGHAHGRENIRALHVLGLGNFVWIPKQGYGMGNTPWNEEHDILSDVDACVERGFHFMISQRRGLGRDFKPGGPEYGGDTTPEIHPPSRVREIARRAGNLFVGLHAEELDADFLQNGLRAGFRSRVPDLYHFSDRSGGRRVFEAELRRIGRLAHASGARYLPNLCVSFHHSGFRSGGDMVLAELLEALPNVDLQLAYMRGGASQFGKPWGVWISPWHRGQVPTEDKALWPGPQSAVGAGHDATRLRRCLYLAWVSGARLLTVQETEPLFSRRPEGYQLAAWGRELRDFWEFVRVRNAPLQPLADLALLVDADNGWAPGHLHGDWIELPTVWAKLPADRGDAMLAAYLDVLLPGFGRTKGWWMPGGKEYPGYFAPTPGGPFDIVSSDIRVERLARYAHVAVMGEVAMTPRLLGTLREYVRRGGRLFINANQLRYRERFVQDAAFLGAVIGESRAWSDWSKSHLLMRKAVSADAIVDARTANVAREPWFAAQDVQLRGAEVVARTSGGEPVLLRHRYGKGEVYLSTPDFLLSDAGPKGERLGYFAELLLRAASSRMVAVEKPEGGVVPDLAWSAARQGRDLVVVLANHGTAPQEVVVRARVEAATAHVERGEADEPRSASAIRIRLPGEDVAVVRFVGTSEH